MTIIKRILFFLVLLAAAMNAGATSEEAIKNFEVAGISARLGASGIDAKLKASGYKFSQSRDIIKYTLMDGKKKARVVTVKTKDGQLTYLRIILNAQKGESNDIAAEAKDILNKMGKPIEPCMDTDRRWTCTFATHADRHVTELSVTLALHKNSYQFKFNRKAVSHSDRKGVQRNKANISCFTQIDASSFDEVLSCMGTYQYAEGPNAGRNRFVSAEGSCQSIYDIYRNALHEAGVETPPTGSHRIPKCGIFARVFSKISARPVYWSGCLEYDAMNVAGHLERCLTTYADTQQENRENTLPQFNSCQRVQERYEYLLKSASASNSLPRHYVRPECDVMQHLIGKWTGQPTK